MPEPLEPILPYQFRTVIANGIGGDEKDRFWLVLSDEDTHQHKIFTSAKVTSARGRTHRSFLFPPDGDLLSVMHLNPASRIDTQQLWTFPFERDDSHTPVPALDDATLVAQLNARLKRRLTAIRDPASDSPYEVGRVVWIRLVGNPENPGSDLHSLQLRLARDYGATWSPGSQLLPAVVLATAVHAKARDRFVLPLITVTPMLHLPVFQERHPSNPTVTEPANEIATPVIYSVLTQLLFTVNYLPAETVVETNNGSRDGWLIRDCELHAIRVDSLQGIGVVP